MRQGELLKKFPLDPLKTFEKREINTDGMFAKISRMLFALTRDSHPTTRQIEIYRTLYTYELVGEMSSPTANN